MGIISAKRPESDDWQRDANRLFLRFVGSYGSSSGYLVAAADAGSDPRIRHDRRGVCEL